MSDELIYKAIPAIMADIKAIGKDSKNESQHYKFRGIDAVYNELHGLLTKHQVFTVPVILEERHEERQSNSGGTLIYRVFKMRYTFYASDGSHVDAVVMGEAMDSGDKASNKAMAVAHKYALLQIFAIPTDEPKDPEDDSPAPGPPVKRTTKKAPAPTEVDIPRLRDDLIEEIRKVMADNAFSKEDRAAVHEKVAAIAPDHPQVVRRLAAIKKSSVAERDKRVEEHKAAEAAPPAEGTEDIPFEGVAPPEAAAKPDDEAEIY